MSTADRQEGKIKARRAISAIMDAIDSESADMSNSRPAIVKPSGQPGLVRVARDRYLRCGCSHIWAHHGLDPLHACRICEACQGFWRAVQS
jgi:hypothetical protein